MAYNSFPYVNMHELNLDYLLNKSKEVQENVESSAGSANAAASSAAAAANSATASLTYSRNSANSAASAVASAADSAESARIAVAAAGDPVTFTAATQLTDTSKIYVYVGETGTYTYGHYYYYQGGTWHDGGVYGTWATDDKLSDSSTNAVQNRVITAAVNSLKSDLNKVYIADTLTRTATGGSVREIHVSIGDIFEVTNETDAIAQIRFRETADGSNLQTESIPANEKVTITSNVNALFVQVYFQAAGTVIIKRGLSIDNEKNINDAQNEIDDVKSDLKEVYIADTLTRTASGGSVREIHVSIGDIFRVTNETDAIAQIRFRETADGSNLQTEYIPANEKVTITSNVNALFVQVYFQKAGTVIIERGLSIDNEKNINDLKAITQGTVSSIALKNGFSDSYNSESMWEQGLINSTTGQNSPSTSGLHPFRIRTREFISAEAEIIICNQGYFIVYKYTANNEFVNVTAHITEFADFENGYKYRLVYSLADGENLNIDTSYWGNVKILSGRSKYNKLIAWGNSFSSDWYEGAGDDYTIFTKNSTYNDVINAYDAINDNSGYMTKETIGTASDGQTMYLYKLIPTYYRNHALTHLNRPPKIMIIPSQHGFEKTAAFATYYFVKDLILNFANNPVLNSLRTKCIFYIVPVANPWGFNNLERKNYNGVDLNRNWGDDKDGYPPESPYYAGASPFDQPETQAIKTVIDQNTDMFLLLDFHTNGGGIVTTWSAVNWLALPYMGTADDYLMELYPAATAHISEITENMIKEYALSTNGTELGNYTSGTSTGSSTLGEYARNVGIIGHTFEGNNGFPSDATSYMPTAQKANSELLGNWIKTVINTYKTQYAR